MIKKKDCLVASMGSWNRINQLLRSPKEEFMLRFAALKAARFIHDYRPDLISNQKIINAYTHLFNQGDIADLAIEDLRKWKAWDQSDAIFAIRKNDAGKVAIVRRSILRFALKCPSDVAKAYVSAARTDDKQGVDDAEELLKLEDAPSPLPSSKNTQQK